MRKREYDKAAGARRAEIAEAKRQRTGGERTQNSGGVEEPAHDHAAKGKSHIASVNGNEACARGTANSACTAGSATTTDHIPTPPMVETSMVAARRSHACRESATGVVAEFGVVSDSIGRHSPT